MSKRAQYEAAIAAGRYGEALAILKTIDDPRARALEAKVRAKMEAEFTADDDDLPMTSAKKPQGGWRRGLLVGWGVVIVVLLVGSLFAYNRYSASRHESALVVKMYVNCLDTMPQSIWDSCFKLAESKVNAYHAEVEHCYDQTESGELSQQFARCLDDNGISF